jgi:hypothetical protein
MKRNKQTNERKGRKNEEWEKQLKRDNKRREKNEGIKTEKKK